MNAQKKITIFTTSEEEEESKWRDMAMRSVDERMRILYELQRIAFPETFDPKTGKRKPLEHKITIKVRNK